VSTGGGEARDQSLDAVTSDFSFFRLLKRATVDDRRVTWTLAAADPDAPRRSISFQFDINPWTPFRAAVGLMRPARAPRAVALARCAAATGGLRTPAGRLRRSGAAVLLAAALGGLGCASGPAQVKLTVTPAVAMNDRRPCYLLVRNVDEKKFLEETYQTVTSKVMQPDDSVMKAAVVFPGTVLQLSVPKPEKGLVAVYVLFTRPTGDWKATVPISQETLELVLEESRLRLPK
jgi:hypothetical protein